jgi:uncharacterized metal-binding protein YceD (DUF177 family)
LRILNINVYICRLSVKNLKSKEYIIEFTKLRKGENEFVFYIDDKFFEAFKGEHPLHADAKVKMILLKTEHMHDLSFEMEGSVKLTCDVCLDEFVMPLEGEFHLIMKNSEVENYSDDEIIYITPNLLEYDLSQYLYESVLISLPIKKVCSIGAKECNSEVLKKLEELNNKTTDNDTEGNDPRWNDLKGIFNN